MIGANIPYDMGGRYATFVRRLGEVSNHISLGRGRMLRALSTTSKHKHVCTTYSGDVCHRPRRSSGGSEDTIKGRTLSIGEPVQAAAGNVTTIHLKNVEGVPQRGLI